MPACDAGTVSLLTDSGSNHEDNVVGTVHMLLARRCMLFHAKDAPDAEARLRQRIQAAYGRGGVITISWHMWNPLTGKNFHDPTPAVHTIQPDDEHHESFLRQLDRVAAFFSSLKGPRGEAIPILFRPFHEHTGSWFWWG